MSDSVEAAPDRRATAFTGGRIFTAGFTGSRPADVLVEGGRIAQITHRGGLDRRHAHVVDLSGRLLLPGFQDAHCHPVIGGQDLLSLDLLGAASSQEVLAAIGG